MKWAALSAVIAAAILCILWLRERPSSAPKVLALMGFLPFALGPFHLYMAAISWPDWPGYVKGVEFSVLDAVALALYIALPGQRTPLPFRISMALYFGAALVSVFQAEVPVAAMFYPWQLARMFLLYAVVARSCSQPDCAIALLKGMAAGIIMEGGVATWQRFMLGEVQAVGTVGHQNLLGLMTHFAAFPFFALLLAATRGWVAPLGTLASLVVQVLTTSRATVGLAAIGYATVFAFSALRHWTPRKTLVLLIAVVTAGVVVPVVMDSFERRFAAEVGSDYDERAAFKTAAAAMISDHPFGVGANHYVLVANVEGYNTRAGVAPIATSLSANVHNVYVLVTAETGYLGLITFVVALFSPVVVAFRCGFRHRKDVRGEMLIGLGVALLTVYFHSFFEWILVTFDAQYLWVFTIGLVAGLAQQLGYFGKPERLQGLSFQGIRYRVEGVPIYHGTHSSKFFRFGSRWCSPRSKEAIGTSATSRVVRLLGSGERE